MLHSLYYPLRLINSFNTIIGNINIANVANGNKIAKIIRTGSNTSANTINITPLFLYLTLNYLHNCKWNYTTLKPILFCYCFVFLFYYHMELHYSQTQPRLNHVDEVFYYHMKLHYSQTKLVGCRQTPLFYYHMKLHYSQTCMFLRRTQGKFYYHMKLHYSQTHLSNYQAVVVLLPYEITLLSNALVSAQNRERVLLPYEITLLSNKPTL